MKKVINTACVAMGVLCLGVGCIGIVIPVLPTTPFLLLALVLFAKGSQRFHSWFLSTKLYKKHLEDFVVTKSMTKAAKIRILSIVTLLLAVGFWFSPVFAKVILFVVAVFHYVYFIFGIKTAEDEKAVPKEEKRRM